MRYKGFNLTAVWLLIAVNLLLFIATSVNQDLILILGLQPVSFLDRPWTIVTNLFVHAEFWHLIGNMMTLYFFGRYVLRLVGEARFLLVYLVGGIVGNILFLLLASPHSIGIGASGAIYALGGVLMVMVPNLKVVILPLPIPLPLWVTILIGLAISFFPGIAWEAHMGGLACGLVAGYFLRRRMSRIL